VCHHSHKQQCQLPCPCTHRQLPRTFPACPCGTQSEWHPSGTVPPTPRPAHPSAPCDPGTPAAASGGRVSPAGKRANTHLVLQQAGCRGGAQCTVGWLAAGQHPATLCNQAWQYFCAVRGAAHERLTAHACFTSTHPPPVLPGIGYGLYQSLCDGSLQPCVSQRHGICRAGLALGSSERHGRGGSGGRGC
jgi:hypothetical protein